MTSSSLASLPAELLAQIFSYLPAKDVVLSVQLVNKLFQDVFTQSTWLNRIVATELAGLELNPLFNADLPSHQVLSSEAKQLLPPPESVSTSTIALSLVQSQEQAWSSFDPKFLAKLEVKHAVSSLYDVVAGHYILGRSLGGLGGFSAALKYLRLPGRGDEDLALSSVPSTGAGTHPNAQAAKDDGPFVWKELNVPGKIIRDFGTALEEHDLIVLVTSCPCRRPTSTKPPPHIQTVDPNALDPKFYPHPTNAALIEDYFDTSALSGPDVNFQPQPLSTEFFSLQIHLAHFSTGQPHTAADLPILPIHVYSKIWNHPSIAVEVVGENLAFIVQYDAVPSPEWCGMLILDWKKGYRKSPWIPVDNSALAFLAEDLLLHPNRKSASLDIYHIEPSQPRSSPIPGKVPATDAGQRPGNDVNSGIKRVPEGDESSQHPGNTASSSETGPVDPDQAENDDADGVISGLYPEQPQMWDELSDTDSHDFVHLEAGLSVAYHVSGNTRDSDGEDEDKNEEGIGDIVDLVHGHDPDDDQWIDEDDSDNFGDGDHSWAPKPKSFTRSITSSSSLSSDTESNPEFQNIPRWLHHPAIRRRIHKPPPRPRSPSSRPIQIRNFAPVPTESRHLLTQLNALGIGPDVDDISMGKGKSKLRLVKRLKLPALRKSRRGRLHRALFNISCRGEPNPSALRSGLDRDNEKEVVLSRLMGQGREETTVASDDASSTLTKGKHSTPALRLPYANPARPFNLNPSKAVLLFQTEFVSGGMMQTFEFVIRREELLWFVRGFGRGRGVPAGVPRGVDKEVTGDDDGMGFDGCYCRTDSNEEESDLGERVRKRIESRMMVVMDIKLETTRDRNEALIDKSAGLDMDLEEKSIGESPRRDKGKQREVPRGEARHRKKQKPAVASGSRKMDDADSEGELDGDGAAVPGLTSGRGRPRRTLQHGVRHNRARKPRKERKKRASEPNPPSEATSIGAAVAGPSHAPLPDNTKSARPRSQSPSRKQSDVPPPQPQLIYTWQDWGGPWLTRWFNSDVFARNYITTTCGERYVRYMDRWADTDTEESYDPDDAVSLDSDSVGYAEEHDGQLIRILERRILPDGGPIAALNAILNMGPYAGATASMGGPSADGGAHVGGSADAEVHDSMVGEDDIVDDDGDQSTHSSHITDLDFNPHEAQQEMATMASKKYGIVLIDFNDARVGKEIMRRKELALTRAKGGADSMEETEPYLGWVDEEKCYKRVVVGATPSSTKPMSRSQRGANAIPVWTHPEYRDSSHIARYLETQGAHKRDGDVEGGSADDQPKPGNSLRDIEVDEVWKGRDAAFLGAMHSLTKRPLYEDDLPSYEVRLAKKLELQAGMTDGASVHTEKQDERRNQFDDGGLFVSEVVSTLSYIEIISKEKFRYESISLEDERILGFELDDTGSAASNWVDVMYFG